MTKEKPQSKWHSRGSVLRKSHSWRIGYWIKTFGLVGVFREDSPGVEWEIDNNKKRSKLTGSNGLSKKEGEIKKVSHTAALINSQRLL